MILFREKGLFFMEKIGQPMLVTGFKINFMEKELFITSIQPLFMLVSTLEILIRLATAGSNMKVLILILR